jgi:hypothetical protein
LYDDSRGGDRRAVRRAEHKDQLARGCQYAVEEVVLTVTFCPAEVVSVKPDVDTSSMVPDDPPAAGPDRALPPPPRTGWAADADTADVAADAVPAVVLPVALTMP